MADTLISLGLAKNWIPRLWKLWKTIREERRQELLEIEKDFVSLEQLEQLARLYIEPECQATNPADHDEDEPGRAIRQPIHGWINSFLKGRFREQDGRNTVFVLSDAGMGKSSLLMMLKLSHLSRFWPSDLDFKLLKLGEKTLEVVDALESRGKTVLLLDALDEDPTAWGRIDERLRELLDATKNFRQVILTCRTQFFPKRGESAIEKPWKVEVGGYVCNLIYLSPFSDEQVEEYLRKVFPDGWRERLRWITRQVEPVRRGRARRAVTKMRSLSMRPMLLKHVHDLMEGEADQWTEYRIYHELVERWLRREVRKQKGKVTKEELWSACTAVALHLQAVGRRELALDELDEVVAREPLADRLKAFDFGGRSLLNRTSERGFRFAHYSIQEFLVAQALVSADAPEVEARVRATDQLVAFLLSWLEEGTPRERLWQVRWRALDVRDLDLVEALRLQKDDLRGAKLRGICFRGANLREADLREADLREADLREADLSFGCLARADLRGSRLDGAVTVGTGFLGARGLDAEIHQSAGPSQPRLLRAASTSPRAPMTRRSGSGTPRRVDGSRPWKATRMGSSRWRGMPAASASPRAPLTRRSGSGTPRRGDGSALWGDKREPTFGMWDWEPLPIMLIRRGVSSSPPTATSTARRTFSPSSASPTAGRSTSSPTSPSVMIPSASAGRWQ